MIAGSKGKAQDVQQSNGNRKVSRNRDGNRVATTVRIGLAKRTYIEVGIEIALIAESIASSNVIRCLS